MAIRSKDYRRSRASSSIRLGAVSVWCVVWDGDSVVSQLRELLAGVAAVSEQTASKVEATTTKTHDKDEAREMGERRAIFGDEHASRGRARNAQASAKLFVCVCCCNRIESNRCGRSIH
jgi:hypothetical protein